MTTDTSEGGLEALVVADMAARGWIEGERADYSRDYAIDLRQLQAFLLATQPDVAEALGLDQDSPTRRRFLARLQGEITSKGVIEVLRKGVKHEKFDLDLYYGTPSAHNAKAVERFAANRFTVVRQLRYSQDETQRSLDVVLFLNGLPIATFEVKNSFTRQTVADAIEQYRRDRNPKELLFLFGRCVVHFAVDDREVAMCTHLRGKESWFLPFNRGNGQDGAGNPPNPNGVATDYLWKEILSPTSLAEILEKYAQIVRKPAEGKDKKAKLRQEFPRYHQLDVVRKLLQTARADGVGRRYLIQHSAGSGKSNSITWLAHQLVSLEANNAKVFDSVIVVTDRRVLDDQIGENIRQFAQVGSILGKVSQGSGQLRSFIEQGKKIIITTIQKFPYIKDEIGDLARDRRFAIIIDEAHSSQGSRTSSSMNAALSIEGGVGDEDDTAEDRINQAIEEKRVLSNASYFAFTATPKNKTLELFGQRQDNGSFRPFHNYAMKQAIEEGFILDVLRFYTPYDSYYRLTTTVENDPEFDTKRAKKKLRKFVESNDHAIRTKAEIMVDHFHNQVLAVNKIGGKARAMVVTSSIERAIQYKRAFDAYLTERKSPYKAIVAFSGEFGPDKLTEASMNQFPSRAIPETFAADPYRFLIAADKFQTGFDQPLLHSMYVDKPLSDVKAVQTLSRLNRSCPGKTDTFVLDFANTTEVIQEAFNRYYRTTILSESTDPNRLHDLKADLDGHQVYSTEDVTTLADRFLSGASRETLDPILDACVATYENDLDEDGQVDFKGKAKTFLRTYGFLSTVLPFTSVSWERLSIFLTLLVPKLPTPREEDLAAGILETIDMDSYRVERQAQMAITLADEEAEIDPVPMTGGGVASEPEIDRLSNIVREFNDLFGNTEWTDRDRIERAITLDVLPKVADDTAYQNAKKNSDKQNARIELESALNRVMVAMLVDHTDLYKKYTDDPEFRRMLADFTFRNTFTNPPSVSL